MSRVEFTMPAGEHDRFAESVAESLIGRPIAVDVDGAGRHAGTIVAAKVTDDGRALLMTVEQAPGPSLFLASVADLDDPPRPFTEHPPTVEVRQPCCDDGRFRPCPEHDPGGYDEWADEGKATCMDCDPDYGRDLDD